MMKDPEINGNLKANFLGNEEELLQEINFSKLKNLGKEYFQSQVEKTISFEQFLKTTAQHFAYNLPPKTNEYFVSLETSKFFWVCNHPLTLNLENYSSPLDKKTPRSNSTKDEIRKFYIRWTSEKSERERLFFASTTKNLIEKSEMPEDLIKHLLASTLILNEDKFYSNEKFNQSIDLANSLILHSNLPEDVKSQFLYYQNIFKSFSNIKNREFEEAKINLQEALNIVPNGITAQFYLAIALRATGDFENSLVYIKNIILFDLERLTFALEVNNLELFNFFLTNSVSPQIFNHKEFAPLYSNIKFIFETLNVTKQTKMKSLSILISKLKELNVEKHYNDAVRDGIIFLENFIKLFTKEKNVFLNMVDDFLFDKLYALIENIKSIFNSNLEVKMNSELNLFNKKHQIFLDEINSLQNDIEKTKERIQATKKENLEKNELKYNNLIAEIENRLSRVDKSQDSNPFMAFNNSLIYNFIISIIVFIVGGFVDGIKGQELSDVQASGLILSVLVSGLKWSSIIFIIGLIISVITMISKVLERSNEKQRLLKQIAQIKTNKEREVEIIKKEIEVRIKEYESNAKNKIEKIRIQIETLIEEKKIREGVLKTNIQEEIGAIQNKLNSIFL
ncbi:MAG: hypothetical protein NTX22_09365 [Ignavibacteriales bacterium]|nr:hypothetical protein [Ignavibacteriales bacterium]